jgi:hypothetical protein
MSTIIRATIILGTFSFVLMTHINAVSAACNTTSNFSVMRGNTASINWSVNNAANCSGDFLLGGATVYPPSTIYDMWNGSVRNAKGGATLGSVTAATGTYTFTCQDLGSGTTGCANLIVSDCTAPLVWDGTACTAGFSASPSTGTLTVSSSSYTIPTGAGLGGITLSWNITNPIPLAASGITSTNSSTTLYTTTTGVAQPVDISGDFSSVTFFLYHNGVELASTTITVSCAVGLSWDGVACTPSSGTLSADPGICTIAPGIPVCSNTNTFTWEVINPVIVGNSQVVGDGGGPYSILSDKALQILTVNPAGQIFRLSNNGGPELASTTITAICLNGANNPPTCDTGPIMTATFNANPTTCIIPAGQSTCPITLDWNVVNPAGPTTAVTRDGTPGDLYTGDSNPGQIENVPYEADGVVVYHLYNNSIEIDPSLTISISVGCAGGPSKWDTVSGICSDPQVGSAIINGDFGYPVLPPAVTTSIEFNCIGSDNYEIRKTPAGANTLFASSTFTNGYSGLIDVPITVSDNYAVICKKGTVASTPEIRFYTPPPPPVATVSINATPKTIDIGGKTVLTWSVQWPIPACTLTATAVCANNNCSQSQIDAATALSTTITSGSTDANDPSGPNRLISTAITTYAPGHGPPEYKALGKKTFDVIHSTNFTLNCGGTNKASTVVRVTNNNEQ